MQFGSFYIPLSCKTNHHVSAFQISELEFKDEKKEKDGPATPVDPETKMEEFRQNIRKAETGKCKAEARIDTLRLGHGNLHFHWLFVDAGGNVSNVFCLEPQKKFELTPGRDTLKCFDSIPVVEVDDWLEQANAQEVAAEEEEEKNNRSSSVMSQKSGSTEGEKVSQRQSAVLVKPQSFRMRNPQFTNETPAIHGAFAHSSLMNIWFFSRFDVCVQ